MVFALARTSGISIYIKRGIRLTCADQNQWVHGGDIFFANWCEPHHAVDFEDETVYYVLQVELSWLLNEQKDMRLARYRDALKIRAQNFDRFIYHDQKLCSIFSEIIKEYERKQIGYEVCIKGLFLKVLGLLFRNHFHSDAISGTFDLYDNSMQYTRSVLNYIAHHYNEPIHLEKLAERTGISKSYLCSLFKKHTGCTIIKYINRMRCYRAISLIETGMSVTQASLEVGYSDYNYFSRVFKKTIGISPSDSMKKIDEDITK